MHFEKILSINFRMTLSEVKTLKRIEGLVEVVIHWFTGNK